ncbi:MAG: diaminopimelate decarboxylase [Candidatus Omnitrophica bacterium]|nr:diaminopimelate decarboxylase [Candidatus Omnitrophota bacterium]
MHYFNFKKGNLYCENLKVKDLASKFDTPLYVYSAKTILGHFSKLKNAFSTLKPLICYSVKANSNLSLLKLLISQGSGLDIVSGGELYRAKKVKCSAKKIVYASVGKTDIEIRDAVKYGILMFNIESLPELERVNKISKELKKKTKVALRFNPDVKPGTHAYITTGKKETKFGMDEETVKSIFASRAKYSNLSIVGIHMHIGSQITKGEPFVKTFKKANRVIRELKRRGVKLEYLNIGGGLGIVYDNEKPQTAKEFAKKVLPLLKESGLKIVLEPGRFIVGNAGILVTKVIYLKETDQKNFIIVDAAMNDLSRPSLYSAYHKIISLAKAGSKKAIKSADVVGPVCESGDFLGKERKISVKSDGLIAVLGAGAYGFSMSSNYNSRPRVAEVLVKNKKAYLIRKRENYQDLIKGEIVI